MQDKHLDLLHVKTPLCLLLRCSHKVLWNIFPNSELECCKEYSNIRLNFNISQFVTAHSVLVMKQAIKFYLFIFSIYYLFIHSLINLILYMGCFVLDVQQQRLLKKMLAYMFVIRCYLYKEDFKALFLYFFFCLLHSLSPCLE